MSNPLRQTLRGLLFMVGLMVFYTVPVWGITPGSQIVVGSKNFLENKLLAEIFAQLIEAKTELKVERRLGLAGTQVCFEALKNGVIDLYPEYTGTGLVSILGQQPTGHANEALRIVRSEFMKRWDLWWITSLGFENSYALAISRKHAEALELRTISDLAKVSPTLSAGLGYEFIKRSDGLPGLQSVYGLQFKQVQGIQQALKYQAVDSGSIDFLDVYTSDGRLAVYDVTILEDDQDFFPPYEAAGLIRGAILQQYPEVGTTLSLLTNAFDAPTMRTLNLRLQERGDSVELVARDTLRSLGLMTITGKEGDELS